VYLLVDPSNDKKVTTNVPSLVSQIIRINLINMNIKQTKVSETAFIIVLTTETSHIKGYLQLKYKIHIHVYLNILNSLTSIRVCVLRVK
jgi:hypothetical protein